VERPLSFGPRTRAIAIGGATIGGSGRTALVLAAARLLSERGARVAIVGHGYRARPLRAHVVSPEDALSTCGDEARMLARALGAAVPVIVAPTRQEAIARAEERADVVFLDGVLQTSPARATLSLLALREESPWGSGRTLPAGDLRARPIALARACDRVVRVRMPLRIVEADAPPVAGARVGVVTAIARPARLVGALVAAGADVTAHTAFPDHGPIDARALLRAMESPASSNPDFWVCTAKCREHVLEAARALASPPSRLFTLDGGALLDEATRDALLSCAQM
jgi:tetraacyldisaccharide 4'-kinase